MRGECTIRLRQRERHGSHLSGSPGLLDGIAAAPSAFETGGHTCSRSTVHRAAAAFPGAEDAGCTNNPLGFDATEVFWPFFGAHPKH